MYFVKIICIGFILGLFASCKKDKPPIKELEPTPIINKQNPLRYFICNEGNFGFGNASLSVWKPSEGFFSEDIYQVNNGKTLGDVAQSIQLFNGSLYVVLNNSGKIVVLDTATFKEKQSIAGFSSPRFIQFVNASKAYVTDLYANKITVFNPSTASIIGNIALNGWTEQMALKSDTLFVTNMKTGFLYLINSSTDVIMDSLFVGVNAGSIVVDKEDAVWICSSGNTTTKARLTRIFANKITYLEFDLGESPASLIYSPISNELYWLNKGVQKMNASLFNLPKAKILEGSSANFYGLSCVGAELFVCDAKDYLQKGYVYRMNKSGVISDSLKVGIIPNSVIAY